ncbi:TPA: type-F conjugative transfer system protein TraW [Yersinia enterocolitica]|nr:type-F conjugative transfer system protein TraW [Yersinia enterocolitica]
MRLFITITLLCCPLLTGARDLGKWGDIYPVQEQSFLNLIQQRLGALEKSGEMAELQQKFKDNVIENTLRPPAVDGLSTDTQSHTLWYDPTFTANQELSDHKGTVFVRKGDKINPLDTLPLNSTLYFLDADDPRQVEWMKAQKPPTVSYKVILVKGNIKTATETLKTRIYFDQGGELTRRFGLTHVPATLTQDNKRLKIVSAPMLEVH